MVSSAMPAGVSSSTLGRYSSYSPSYASYLNSSSSSSASSYINRTTSLERSSLTGSNYLTSGYYRSSRYGTSGSSSSGSTSSALPPRPSFSSSTDTYRSNRSLRVSPVRSSYSSRISSDSSLGVGDSSSLRDTRYSSTRYRESSTSRDSGYGSRYSSRDRERQIADILNGNSYLRRQPSLDRSTRERERQESVKNDEEDTIKVSERVRAFEIRRDSTEERLNQRRLRLGLGPARDTSRENSRRASLSRRQLSEDNITDSENDRTSVSELRRKYSSNQNLSNGISRSDDDKGYYEMTGCSGGATSAAVKDHLIDGVRPVSPLGNKIKQRQDSLSKREHRDSTTSDNVSTSGESSCSSVLKAASSVTDLLSASPKEAKAETDVSVTTSKERESSAVKAAKTQTSEPYSVRSLRDSTDSLSLRSRERRDRVKERIAARLAAEEAGDDTPTRKRSPTRGGSSSSFCESDGLVGLRNIGNTCFLNSITQCLSNTRCLMEYLVREGYSSDINTTLSTMKGDLVKAFASLLSDMWREGSSAECRSPINTGSFKSQIQRFAPAFIGYAQHDAQEFLRKLLEGLHEDVNRVSARPRPITEDIEESLDDNQKAMEAWKRYLRYDDSKIVDMFVGQLKSSLQCSICGHRSVTFDPFWDLSLPIPSRSGQVKLSQCLDLFTKEEVLDGDERPTCAKCKERRKMTKTFSIQKFPKVLVLHLKRFSPHERWRGKLTCMVEFPVDSLDFSRYAACSSISCQYKLIGVANHSGTALSGHYTAYCRHPYNSTWHEYNDSRVSSISANRVCSPEAYVLFYELSPS